MTESNDELLWYVAHTRPRCEKKLAEYCEREGLFTFVPCYKSIKKYPSKTVTFDKVLFPNYVFLRIVRDKARTVYQSDYVANLLTVVDQQLFEQQLDDIRRALESGLEVVQYPDIKPGIKVRITSGPLRGLEGWVEQRKGEVDVVLRLDFISQCAAVKMDASSLELA